MYTSLKRSSIGGLLFVGLCIAFPAHAQRWTEHDGRIESRMQPEVNCTHCNPGRSWEGEGAESAAILSVPVVGGDRIKVAALGGTVTSENQSYDCRTGRLPGARVPVQMPIFQFLDAAGRVLLPENSGYNSTSAIRLTDIQRAYIRVPNGATTLIGSWPDSRYTDNFEGCHFRVFHIPAAEWQKSSIVNKDRFGDPVGQHADGSGNHARSDTDGIQPHKPAPTLAERLACRMQSNFKGQQPSQSTLTRSAQRLAEKADISQNIALSLLTNTALCNRLQEHVPEVSIPSIEEQHRDFGIPWTPNTVPHTPSTPGGSNQSTPSTPAGSGIGGSGAYSGNESGSEEEAKEPKEAEESDEQAASSKQPVASNDEQDQKDKKHKKGKWGSGSLMRYALFGVGALIALSLIILLLLLLFPQKDEPAEPTKKKPGTKKRR